MNENQTTQNKNLIECKTCGAQMAKSAKACPSCGGKNKKKSLIKIIIPLVIILVLGALYAVKVMNVNSTDAILKVNGTEYSWTEYKDLYHNYYLNGKAIEFSEEFVPANATYTGEITKISNAIIGETMNGNIPTKNTFMKYEIIIDDGCTYSFTYNYYDQNDYDFSHLSVGDTVTVNGAVTEDNLFPTNRIEEYLDAKLKIEGTLEGITKE